MIRTRATATFIFLLLLSFHGHATSKLPTQQTDVLQFVKWATKIYSLYGHTPFFRKELYQVRKERQDYERIQRACGTAARIYSDKTMASGPNAHFSAKFISIGEYQDVQTKRLLKQELIKRISHHKALLERHLPSDRYFKYLFFMKLLNVQEPQNLRRNILNLSREILNDVQNDRFKSCSEKIKIVLNVSKDIAI